MRILGVAHGKCLLGIPFLLAASLVAAPAAAERPNSCLQPDGAEIYGCYGYRRALTVLERTIASTEGKVAERIELAAVLDARATIPAIRIHLRSRDAEIAAAAARALRELGDTESESAIATALRRARAAPASAPASENVVTDEGSPTADATWVAARDALIANASGAIDRAATLLERSFRDEGTDAASRIAVLDAFVAAAPDDDAYLGAMYHPLPAVRKRAVHHYARRHDDALCTRIDLARDTPDDVTDDVLWATTIAPSRCIAQLYTLSDRPHFIETQPRALITIYELAFLDGNTSAISGLEQLEQYGLMFYGSSEGREMNNTAQSNQVRLLARSALARLRAVRVTPR